MFPEKLLRKFKKITTKKYRLMTTYHRNMSKDETFGPVVLPPPIPGKMYTDTKIKNILNKHTVIKPITSLGI